MQISVLLIDPSSDRHIKLRPTIFVITTWKILNENSQEFN